MEIPASGRLFRDSRQEEGCVLSENRINAEVLIGEARKVRQKAYAPYSGFLVGAALLGADGKIYTGCNVENASFGAGICAERSAFVRAVSEGEKEFLAIAIVGGKKEEQTSLPCPPCGICRQFMREFCDPESFRIILENSKEGKDIFLLKELLPMSFGPAQLGT